MKKLTIISLIILTFLLSENVFGQSAELDSLKKVLISCKVDTIKLEILSELNWQYSGIDAKLAKEYGFQELTLSNKIGNKKWIAQSYNDIGISYFKLGLLDSALNYYNKSLSIRKSLNDKALIASSLSKIGIIYVEQGDFNKALKSNIDALKIYEESGNENYQALTLNNISVIFDKLKNYDKVIEYGEKAIAIHLKNENDYQAAFCYSNLAEAYKSRGDIKKSNDYLQKGLAIFIKYEDKSNEAAVLNSIGLNLRSEFKNNEALIYYLKAYNIAIQLNDKLSVSLYGHNISGTYSDMGNYVLAEKYSLQSLENTEPTNKYQLALIFRQLANLNAFLGNGGKAKFYLDKYVDLKDSIFNIESSSQMAEMETKYQTEKKDKELVIKDAEIVKQQADASKKAIQRNAILVGFLLVLVFSILLFRLFLQKKRANQILAIQNIEIRQQKEEITSQRDEIEAQRDKLSDQNTLLFNQKRAITDSINYAKRIQTAVLPTGEYACNILGEHFILFKPKDIVSGDFYWGTRINEWLIVVVADCTGHGVPGAFMSMLGVSFLNEIVRKKEITQTNQVLEELRKSLIESLQQKGTSKEQKDGMDIVLCAINTTTNELQFSGANNSLYIVNSQKELKELLPDKQPVGIYEKMKPFTTQHVQLNKGDCVYFATDGYKDQFGGPGFKKFMSKQLRELLVDIADKPMDRQKELLDIAFENWIGAHEQIDDVTILGLKI